MGEIAALPQRASSSVGVGARVGRIAFWSLVVGLSIYFVVQDGVLRHTIPYFADAEDFVRRHGGHGAWLLLHIVAGTAALLIGPLQFSSTLRRRNIAVHRWSGRVYLVSVAASVVAAIRIQLDVLGAAAPRHRGRAVGAEDRTGASDTGDRCRAMSASI